MRLIIAGSRNFYLDITTIQDLLDTLIPMDIEIEEIVSGKAKGIDKSGENWARFQNIPIEPFKPDWNNLEHPNAVIKTRKDGSKYNSAAGPIRNKQMAEYADALLLIWDGKSKGSSSMKREMKKLNKPIYEVIIRSNSTGEEK